jgi:branched-subunit amino acid aminotransferase/4-amino-4-deoxychorismate lyase
MLRVELDGRRLGADAEFAIAAVGYGHFTAMQVRAGRTRGLDLHLARLQASTRELFDAPLDGDVVRARIRQALGEVADASVRVHVSKPGADVSTLVTVRPPAVTPPATQSVKTVRYQRPIAHIKHSGGFAQHYWGLQVEAAGFDEGLLTDERDVISEGTITNLGCWDGQSVIWPDAPSLAGITMQILQRHLDVPSVRKPIRVGDLPGYRAAFLTNSHGISAVNLVNDVKLPIDDDFMCKLHDAYDGAPWQTI